MVLNFRSVFANRLFIYKLTEDYGMRVSNSYAGNLVSFAVHLERLVDDCLFWQKGRRVGICVDFACREICQLQSCRKSFRSKGRLSHINCYRSNLAVLFVEDKGFYAASCFNCDCFGCVGFLSVFFADSVYVVVVEVLSYAADGVSGHFSF